jgi:DNA-binding PadR family transcriptional regulator
MSLGHGKAQRRILGLLAQWKCGSAWDIAKFFVPEGVTVTQASIETVRRALRTLEREGLVTIYPGVSGTTKFWALTATHRKRAASESARARAKANRNYERLEEEYSKLRKEALERLRKEQPERDVLVKILGMLGSEHDGEALAAARNAEKLRSKLGLGWDQIVQMSLQRSDP